MIVCKVSTFGSLYTLYTWPWHHNSVPAHIGLHSGLFKLSLIHIPVKPGTSIWKSCSSFRRLSRLHWHCNSIQFRESLVLSKDRIEFQQTFRNQAAIKQCPKQTVRHIHTRERSERKKNVFYHSQMILQTLLEASYQWDLWYCGLSAMDPSLSPARRCENWCPNIKVLSFRRINSEPKMIGWFSGVRFIVNLSQCPKNCWKEKKLTFLSS